MMVGMTTCSICGKQYDIRGFKVHELRHNIDISKSTATGKIKVIRTVSDESCPKCGYPEIVIVRDAENGESLRRECSSKSCHYQQRCSHARPS